MRSLLAGAALFVLGTAAASAQPYYGYDRPPPPPPYGYDRRPPPPPRYYGGPPRRCFIRDTPYGPRRICRPVYY